MSAVDDEPEGPPFLIDFGTNKYAEFVWSDGSPRVGEFDGDDADHVEALMARGLKEGVFPIYNKEGPHTVTLVSSDLTVGAYELRRHMSHAFDTVKENASSDSIKIAEYNLAALWYASKRFRHFADYFTPLILEATHAVIKAQRGELKHVKTDPYRMFLTDDEIKGCLS